MRPYQYSDVTAVVGPVLAVLAILMIAAWVSRRGRKPASPPSLGILTPVLASLHADELEYARTELRSQRIRAQIIEIGWEAIPAPEREFLEGVVGGEILSPGQFELVRTGAGEATWVLVTFPEDRGRAAAHLRRGRT